VNPSEEDTTMPKLWRRARVVLTAAPSYLVAASTAVTIVMEEVDAPGVAKYGAIAVGALGAAIAIIRRVTPVLPDDRGLLPPVDDTTPEGA
jgi:hypothetical protein